MSDFKTLPAEQTTKPPIRVVEDNSSLANLLDSARFEHLQRIALTMASASLVPDHLRGKSFQETTANCFLVVNQALRWGLDPFAVAAMTYVVKGRLGFEGKLIMGLVNTRANLARGSRLRYEFKGTGDSLTVTVVGRFADEDLDRTVEVSVGQAKTDNKIWQTDPEQKLVYTGATKWARRHCPEILLGVLDDDDLEQLAEARAISAGPTTEAIETDPPRSLEQLTDKLLVEPAVERASKKKAAARSETEPAKPTAKPSEPAAEETAEDLEDWPKVSHLFRERIKLHQSVMQVQSDAKQTVAYYPTMPAEVETRIKALAELRILEIKAARGESSASIPAKEQRVLIQ